MMDTAPRVGIRRTLAALGLAALLLGACAPRDAAPAAQVQPVAQATAPAPPTAPTPTIDGMSPPGPTPANTFPPGVVISTPVVVPTPTFAGPYPTRDPRTPTVPVATPDTPTPVPTTRLLTPGPTHTPGPTPTNPPGEEPLVRAAFDAAVQDRVASGQWKPDTISTKIVINDIRIEGEWAIIGIRADTAAGRTIPGSGSLALARKHDRHWQIAFRFDPDYRPWFEIMPDTLMPPQLRRYFS